MELLTVTEHVRGIPWMSPHQGELIYNHVIATSPELVLELGTANGVSAAYIAAALDENEKGRLVTVDREGSGYQPRSLLEGIGLLGRVDVVVRDDSSYDWFLKEEIERRSDESGNCEPLYDFCYLDGAHNWTIDGLAVFLVEKLLKEGAWLLLDDLEWSYASSPSAATEPFPLSASERTEPHVRAVFDLIVKQHPHFTQFRVEDGNWGWARKSPDLPRRYEITTSRSIGGLAASAIWKLARSSSAVTQRLRSRSPL